MPKTEIEEIQSIETLRAQLADALTLGFQSGDLTTAQALQAEINAQIKALEHQLHPYPTYEVHIDHNQSLNDLVLNGKWRYINQLVNQHIGQAKPFLSHIQPYTQKISLINFNYPIPAASAIDQLADLGFRPIDLYELMSLANQHQLPSVVDHPIVALAQSFLKLENNQQNQYCAFLGYQNLQFDPFIGVASLDKPLEDHFAFAVIKRSVHV